MFKFIHHYFRGRWERYYIKSHWHLVLDLSMLIIILMLAACIIGFYIYRPSFIFQASYTHPAFDLNNPSLTLNFSVASSTAEINEGSLLKINYKNNGTAPISNLILDLTTINTDFSIDKLVIKKDKSLATVSGQSLILPKIAAGSDGEVDLQVYFNVKNPAARTINWQAQSEYTFSGQPIKMTSALPVINLAAVLNAKDEAYYTSLQGDQLGIGPLPPVVGIPTDYWIFWSASSDNNFHNVIFNARLPKGVELAPGRTLLAGEFSYTTSTRQIIWRINNLTGGDDSYRLGFAVRITPTATQVGTVLPLLETTQYYAEDSLTGNTVSGSLPTLTTNLDHDRFNVGQGEVVKQ
jgi:hypothetical protein